MQTWNYYNIGLAIVIGVVITVVTGLLNVTPGGGFVGATWYGYPTAWLIYRVLAPQYSPWAFNWGNFAIDVVFWFVVTAAIMWLLEYDASRAMKGQPMTNQPAAKPKQKK